MNLLTLSRAPALLQLEQAVGHSAVDRAAALARLADLGRQHPEWVPLWEAAAAAPGVPVVTALVQQARRVLAGVQPWPNAGQAGHLLLTVLPAQVWLPEDPRPGREAPPCDCAYEWARAGEYAWELPGSTWRWHAQPVALLPLEDWTPAQLQQLARTVYTGGCPPLPAPARLTTQPQPPEQQAWLGALWVPTAALAHLADWRDLRATPPRRQWRQRAEALLEQELSLAFGQPCTATLLPPVLWQDALLTCRWWQLRQRLRQLPAGATVCVTLTGTRAQFATRGKAPGATWELDFSGEDPEHLQQRLLAWCAVPG